MDITSFVHSQREKAFLIGDYAAYHDQCGRHAASLRRKLKIATPKNHKFQKKGPLTADQVSKGTDHVQLHLVAAERAWAHAMSVKNQQSQEDTENAISGNMRKYIIMRLRKAATYADELVSIVKQRAAVGASTLDYLEAQAYSLYLFGSLEFEKQFNRRFEDPKAQRVAWNACLTAFSEAHVIYSALLTATQKDVFKEILTGTIEPSIRYAAYQSRYPRATPLASIAKQHFRKDREYLSDVENIDPTALRERKASLTTVTKDGTTTADIPTEITWRERSAPIADASIGAAIAATSLAADHLNRSLTSLSSTKEIVAAYDPVLTAAQDAVDAIRSALSEVAREGISESDSRVQDLRVTDLAANYTLISWRIGRNRALVSASASALDDGLVYTSPTSTARVPRSRKAQAQAEANRGESGLKKEAQVSRGQKIASLRDRAVLYASTLQSLDDIAALPGASRDTSFIAEIDAQKSYFRALRCLNIGYSHQILSRDHGKQALALFAKAAELAAAAAPNATADRSGAPDLSVSPSQVQALQAHSKLMTARQQGLVLLQDVSKKSSEGEANPPPFISNTFSYPTTSADLRNVVDVPPKLEPVPVKPIFLDVAYNYITYPGQEQYEPAIAEGGDEEPTNDISTNREKRKSGWFGGLLGR